MTDFEDDPGFRDSKREAWLILAIWCLCLFWTVPYCYLTGYTEHRAIEGEVSGYLPDMARFDRDPARLTTPFGLGVPDWIFWGVVVPWGICILVSTWFCFFFMKDDDQTIANGSGRKGRRR